jgi:hypothetical protein
MPAWLRQMRWMAFAALLALGFIAVPLASSEAHNLAAGIPCLHLDDEVAKTAPLLSPLTRQPCDQYHCAHGAFCCMSSCLGGLAVAPETPFLAPSFGLARFPFSPTLHPNGFGLRPALPPPRALV